MEEYDFDYDKDRVRGPGFPLYKVHNLGSLPGPGFWIVIAVVFYLLLG
jgi:hypothetical protein